MEYGGRGRPILLIHGLGGSTTNYDAIGPALNDHGQVLAIDLPGFGLTPPRKDFTLHTHRLAIETYLEMLDEPAILLGNSTGGLLAKMVASHRPDLVAGLVLVSPATPPVFPDPRIDWPTLARLTLQAIPVLGEAVGRYLVRRYTPEELVHLMFDIITHKPGRVPMHVVEASIDMARIRVKLPWAPAATTRTATSIAMTYARRSDYVRMIRKIVAPTLVVQGSADRYVSPSAVEWACSLRPDWQLIQMEDTGHTPQLDAPLRLVEVVDRWLDEDVAAIGA
jgi:pimeloyl-ACP methyl ester carboxylesterase